ncbi:MAG TPA: hypothetical protein DC042_01950 [Bacteroidales bacterium]|nr:hypothetical protein [Bacteroidales bacterium]
MKSTKALLFFILISAVALKLPAQSLDISIRSYPSSWYNGYFEPAFDGSGLTLAWHPRITDKLRLTLSGEFDILRARSEMLIGTGVSHSLWTKNRLMLSLGANLLNGIDLYKPHPLYVGGAEAVFRLDCKIGKKNTTLFALIGARYTICPGYKEYGVYQYNSWPVGIGIGF